MADTEAFIEKIKKSYDLEGISFPIGCGVLDGRVHSDGVVKIPLGSLNRHGLVSGATGTGKTKTVQILAEHLSSHGVPTLLMDLKGDMSGLAKASPGHPKIDERHESLKIEFTPQDYPVEFLTLSNDHGSKLRATLIEFGPVLFSKILGLNGTQTSVTTVIFKYCDDTGLPLLDLTDFKEVLRFIGGDQKDEFEKLYGKIAPSTVSTILRKIVELEQQGANEFLGEPSFDVEDLLHSGEGKASINILRLTNIQGKPKLFSTFMLSLLSEIYETFPEVGDSEKPKLCLFIDEAHLVFEEASDTLVNQLEQVVKLIRSKGVGVFFCTQNPVDVPESILSQLGLKIQHSLRAFTAKDRKAIKSAAENFPISDFYKIDQLITELGIGEALVTVLDHKGRPTELVHTMLRAPQTRMGILDEKELKEVEAKSKLKEKYDKVVDRKSAYEILTERINGDDEPEVSEDIKKTRKEKADDEEGFFASLSKNTMIRQVGRTVTREVTRGLLGALGIKTTRRRSSRRKTGWF